VIPAYLGLGSNLGDSARLLAEAVRLLRTTPGIKVTAVSPVYDTIPVGVTGQPNYLNLVVAIATDLAPGPLLTACQGIENALGRTRGVRWGARTIDLDLLCYGDLVSDDPVVTLPHPRLAQRAFALVPLATLAPDLRVAGRTVRELAAAADASGVRECPGIRIGE
jgi:2-amino-4-hydroxy-6-hydroxymethyldihydropteridine diphosphokinase